MTDKEWKELCEWAENYDNDRISVEYNILHTEATIYIKELDDEPSYLYGLRDALVIFNTGCICCAYNHFCIAENRTAKQMKTIIENLL